MHLVASSFTGRCTERCDRKIFSLKASLFFSNLSVFTHDLVYDFFGIKVMD